MLIEDEYIDDVAALPAVEIPEWLKRLGVPRGWELSPPADGTSAPWALVAVTGPRGSGEWDAAETISVFGYTGRPLFSDVFHNADRMLRGMNASDIAVKVLPIPPVQWTAAVRSSGIAHVRDRSVWVQQSNYVAGSDQPHAGRLIVHSLFVETASQARLSDDIREASDAVYEGFVAGLADT
ncbi:hypothetical protein AWB93_02990 [Mycobacterium bohemicum]|uniref:Uncharacterized protein n=1 Tax=Mycobacterium bohemicum TaxID=56425 RepID=A0A1X1RBT7_MYCBE|nr:hypothetical protein [Mycobacterium bohemicum]ORV02794.1 hypothetical protein AWB93_02990 [Mycobacterium bohemicum]